MVQHSELGAVNGIPGTGFHGDSFRSGCDGPPASIDPKSPPSSSGGLALSTLSTPGMAGVARRGAEDPWRPGRDACPVGPAVVRGRGSTRPVSLGGLGSWLDHIAGRQPFFPHQLSFILELPLRALLITPSQLADRLHLQPNSQVLEVGCGSGVFSVEVARRLSRGHLELFDLQPQMLAKARRKIDAAGLGRVVGYTQGDARKLALRAAQFDVAFMVAVLGEIPEPSKCLAALARVIRPGGLLSITEHLPDPDFSRFSTLYALVERAGFVFVERFGPPWSYTANFRRPRRRAGRFPSASRGHAVQEAVA